MPRYLIERTFPNGLGLSPNKEGQAAAIRVIANNADAGVTWVHSYVTPDKTKTFCIYDGPSPEAIRKVAERNGLPVERITEVRILDPYFHM
jgi:predicted amidohydrolase YtcJ